MLLTSEQWKLHKQREVSIQRKLEEEIGFTHAKCRAGVIDILTPTTIIEIKRWSKWKAAIGQLFAYRVHCSDKKLRIHFFGPIPAAEIRDNILYTCSLYGIETTWEKEEVKMFKIIREDEKGEKYEVLV